MQLLGLIQATTPQQDGYASGTDGRGRILVCSWTTGTGPPFEIFPCPAQYDADDVGAVGRFTGRALRHLATPLNCVGRIQRVRSRTETNTGEPASRRTGSKGADSMRLRRRSRETVNSEQTNL